ncbi:MAG: TolB family protein, partial [Candidatus Zixiibacteriota bacterium]
MAHSSINNGRLGLRCGRSAVSALAAGAFLCWSLSSCSESESDSFSHTGEIPDMSTFIQIGGCGLAGLNWQGDGMYFTSSMSGKSQVFRHMGKHQWPWQLTVFSDGIDGFTLSEDGKWGIVRASVGGSEQSQLYLMNMSNGAVDTLTDFEKTQTGSVIWAPDNESIFFRSNHETEGNFQVYRMDILAREITPVFDQPEYDIPAGITRDGAGLFVYSFRSNADNDLHLVDLQTGESTKLNEGDGEFNYFNPTLMPDGKTVFMLSNNNTDGITRIARMRLGNPSLEYVTDWIDPKWTIDDLGFSRDFKY